MESKETPFPQRKHPLRTHFDYSGDNPFYVTIPTLRRTRFFENQQLAQEVLDVLHHLINRKMYTLYAFCLMPDRLHMFVTPAKSGMPLDEFVEELKTVTTKAARKRELAVDLWQASFYEHILRKDAAIREVADYVVQSPVRLGLVKSVEAYPFSGMPAFD